MHAKTLCRDGILLRESEGEYRAKAKDILTSHQLGDFRRCPALYHKKKIGLMPDEDRPAFLMGRAVHTWGLEGREKFDRAYAVGGPMNSKTGKRFGASTQAYNDWAAAQAKDVLTDDQYEMVSNLVASIAAHAGARELISVGTPEGVVRTQYCGVPCQGRMDWFNPDRGIADLKTCDDLTWFEADARRYGYANQMAFYQSLLTQLCGNAVPVHMIAVEKKEPYRCGVWQISEQALAYARKENEAAIDRLKRCQDSGVWPTGYEETRVFDFA